MNETRAIKVTVSPREFISAIYGITTLERARTWGERQGYAIVYWHRRLQRAYGIVKFAKKTESEEK